MEQKRSRRGEEVNMQSLNHKLTPHARSDEMYQAFAGRCWLALESSRMFHAKEKVELE